MARTLLKSLVALGLLAAAGQGFAKYSLNGPHGGPYNFSRYCGGLDRQNGSGLTIVTSTLKECEDALDEEMARNPGFRNLLSCHVCEQKFTSPKIAHDSGSGPVPTDGSLDPAVAHQFIERVKELRRRYDIDAFERELDALSRSMSAVNEDE